MGASASPTSTWPSTRSPSSRRAAPRASRSAAPPATRTPPRRSTPPGRAAPAPAWATRAATTLTPRGGASLSTFDVVTGRLTAESDLAGSKASPPYRTTLTYDGAGHLSKVTDPAGRAYTVTWTGNHISGLSDSAGRQVTYGYDSEGNLTDVLGVGTTRTPSVKD